MIKSNWNGPLFTFTQAIHPGSVQSESITKPGMRIYSGLWLKLHTRCPLHDAKMSIKLERVSQILGEGV